MMMESGLGEGGQNKPNGDAEEDGGGVRRAGDGSEYADNGGGVGEGKGVEGVPGVGGGGDEKAGNDDLGDEDEEEEGDDDDEEESYEDADEDEDEPQLKYQRLGGDIGAILQREAAACLAVHEKFLCCGTHEGSVHILDLAGNLIRSIAVHSTTVNDLSMDDTADHVASCSNDGKIVITNLFSAEAKTFNYPRPVKTVSLDPLYTRKNTGQFASGGLAGQLMLRTKGWLFSQKDQVLHKGEGPVTTVRWRGNLIAWANSVGVKVYDCKNNERISYIERDDPGTRPDLHRCNLFWERDDLLLIGWERSIKIGRVREKPLSDITIGLPTRYVEIVALFETDYFICGLAPFDKRLVVLGYVGADGADLAGAADEEGASRPQLRVVTRDNEEVSSDALEVRGFETFSSLDYRLEHIPSESLFYIVSPRDIVVAKPRDRDDHVAWLLERERYEEALRVVEEHGESLRHHNAVDVGERYLASLMQRGEFGDAAAMLPVIFKADAKQHWEKWIFVFHKMGQLRTISPFIPVNAPRLTSTVYEMVLNEFLMRDPERFLRLVTSWPCELYSVKTIIDKVLARQRTEDSPVLMDALAALYTYEKDYGRTLEIYLRLKRPTVFNFIEEHALFDAVPIRQLLDFDPRRAIDLFVQHTDRISIDEVVAELEVNRPLQHEYLHRLFQEDVHIASRHHAKQVALYADFDRKNLAPFLRQSNDYPLESALAVCQERALHEETVFILGRMGNSREALGLIIQELGSVAMAMDFVTEQDDEELWEDLIEHSISNPAFVGGLLENIGSHVDPLKLLKRIPEDMEIPGLRDKLAKITSDYHLQVSLREGCTAVLKSDVVELSRRLNRHQKRAVRVDIHTPCPLCGTPVMPGRGQGGANGDEDQVVAFFCSHTYHLKCLAVASGKETVAAAESPARPRGPAGSTAGAGDDARTREGAGSSEGHLHCVLCVKDSENTWRSRFSSRT